MPSVILHVIDGISVCPSHSVDAPLLQTVKPRLHIRSRLKWLAGIEFEHVLPVRSFVGALFLLLLFNEIHKDILHYGVLRFETNTCVAFRFSSPCLIVCLRSRCFGLAVDLKSAKGGCASAVMSH